MPSDDQQESSLKPTNAYPAWCPRFWHGMRRWDLVEIASEESIPRYTYPVAASIWRELYHADKRFHGGCGAGGSLIGVSAALQ